MKKSKGVVLGAAALCVGMLGVAGCNNQVMGQRDYVADPGAAGGYQDGQVAPMQQFPQNVPPQQAVPQQVAPQQVAPAQPQRPAVPQYVPMEKLSSSPVTSVSGQAGSSGAAVSTKGGTTHVIKAGDTVGHLAKRYGVSTASIMQANNLDEAKARRLRIGQKLVIPGATGAVKVSGRSSGRSSVGNAAVSAKGGLNADGTYSVQPGDFPGKIARKLGVKESELMKANNLTQESAKRLQVGQKLIVPGKGGSAAASVASKPSVPATTAPTAPRNDLESELEKTLSGAEVPAVPGETPQVTPGATSNAPAEATAVVEEELDLVGGESTPKDVTEDTTVEEFAAKYNTTVEKLKELNVGMMPEDGKLMKGQILFVPAQK